VEWFDQSFLTLYRNTGNTQAQKHDPFQIWGDGLVYDNGSQQALGGGSIKIHQGK
jgi:hypothetical protein